MEFHERHLLDGLIIPNRARASVNVKVLQELTCSSCPRMCKHGDFVFPDLPYYGDDQSPAKRVCVDQSTNVRDESGGITACSDNST